MKKNPSIYIQSALKRLDAAKRGLLDKESLEEEAVALASDMLEEALARETRREKKRQKELSRMMSDPKGKAFTTQLTDQCFRSHIPKKAADQLIYLLKTLGIPQYLGIREKISLRLFRLIGSFAAPALIPLVMYTLRKKTASVILPGEEKKFLSHIKKRRKERIRINLNHLGEAILGEEEASRRLEMYLQDLKHPSVQYISIKISTIYSQIHLLGMDNCIEVLSERLRKLYRACMENTFTKIDGGEEAKFVNLDMEEYRDLYITKELFKKVLSEEEFLGLSAGIVLQAYLPDCFLIQQELTAWAKERVSKGGAPIKIRIVKGANLAMEHVEASIRGWAQAPYKTKEEVDANYKKMVTFGTLYENAKVAWIGIGSHNLFDIAHVMLLRAQNNVEPFVSFEMLEGMAEHIRRAVLTITNDILLYCPVSTKEEFQNAIAYLIRRLDENTGPENFLRHTFDLTPSSKAWQEQAEKFAVSYEKQNTVFVGARKQQKREEKTLEQPIESPFENEPDTDFSQEANRKWAHAIALEWKNKKEIDIPSVIGGQVIWKEEKKRGYDPSCPEKPLYTYNLASLEEIEKGIGIAKQEEKQWKNISCKQRAKLLAQVAQKLREKRKDLVGVMMADGGKALLEADTEVSEAIDFAEYYLRSSLEMDRCKELTFSPKGTVLVTPPWNFPIAIPAGGILAALAAGNCVLFKPAPEATFCGWVLVNILWEAGIPKNVLQFFSCEDDPTGSSLLKDTRINAVILTGATATAELFLKIRPDLTLLAETGGKNALIITSFADRDIAIRDLLQSAFGHAGQKCSAASLAILEAEVYDDPHFLQQLKDAAKSLKVDSAWALDVKIPPLAVDPSHHLLKGLTTLEEGESWLVKPKQDKTNPRLWSPGIKLGVKPGSFMHTTELFGPVLSLMRANSLEHAINLANQTRYGLTSGIISLDLREISFWLSKIEAGNLYINRTTTGAIVKRQPFGGCKASSFGPGIKAGGPHYVSALCDITQKYLPEQKASLPLALTPLMDKIEKIYLSQEDLGILYESLANYAFVIRKLPMAYDIENPAGLTDLVVGQDNALFYVPRKALVCLVQENDKLVDLLRVVGACIITNTFIEISLPFSEELIAIKEGLQGISPLISIVEEEEASLIDKIRERQVERIRLLSPCSKKIQESAANTGCYLDNTPVLASGYYELLKYLREVSVSYDYHRYGSLGLREAEPRKPII